MGSVTVTPEEFTFVLFDAGELAATMTELLDRLGLGDRDVRGRGRRDVAASPGCSVDVRAIRWWSGPRAARSRTAAGPGHCRPRRWSRSAGRMLLRLRDRAGAGFADAPPDDDLTLAETAAWDAYSVGRLARLGYPPTASAGSTTSATATGSPTRPTPLFDRLWTADGLTWAEIGALSEQALGARRPRLTAPDPQPHCPRSA